MLYGTGSGALARQAIGSTGNVLTVSGGLPVWSAPAGGGKVLQVVAATYSSVVYSNSGTLATTNLTAAITPSLATSRVLVLISQAGCRKTDANSQNALTLALFRDATNISTMALILGLTATAVGLTVTQSYAYLDSPATTSSTTYSTKFANYAGNTGQVQVQGGNDTSSIVLMEIGA